MQFLIGKLNQTPEDKGGTIELPSRFQVEGEIREKQAIGVEPFVNRNTETVNLDSELSNLEKAQFESLLMYK